MSLLFLYTLYTYIYTYLDHFPIRKDGVDILHAIFPVHPTIGLWCEVLRIEVRELDDTFHVAFLQEGDFLLCVGVYVDIRGGGMDEWMDR